MYHQVGSLSCIVRAINDNKVSNEPLDSSPITESLLAWSLRTFMDKCTNKFIYFFMVIFEVHYTNTSAHQKSEPSDAHISRYQRNGWKWWCWYSWKPCTGLGWNSQGLFIKILYTSCPKITRTQFFVCEISSI